VGWAAVPPQAVTISSAISSSVRDLRRTMDISF
jgi:hypothetical protein